MLFTRELILIALSQEVIAAYLVWLLGLGGGYHPDQGPVPVVTVGAVHQELVLGAADSLPLRIALPGEQWTVEKITRVEIN